MMNKAIVVPEQSLANLTSRAACGAPFDVLGARWIDKRVQCWG